MDIMIENWTFDFQASCELSLRCNRKRFIIVLSPDPPPDFDSVHAIELQYLHRLNAAIALDDARKQFEILQEIRRFVVRIGQHWFGELAPVDAMQYQGCTLDTLLTPETFMLQVVTSKGEANVTRRNDMLPTPCRFRPSKMTELNMDLPTLYPDQIQELERLRQLRISKVLVDGRIRCCKLAIFPYSDVSRELRVLQAIAKADLDQSIRIPRLRGLVTANDGNGLIGFLMDFIEGGQGLYSIKKEIGDIERVRRGKWADQVEHTIMKLHHAGIVWGDAKADNIVIDTEDDAWLVDFDGSWTEVWVGRDKQDTEEGDLQALQLIRDFLKL